MKMLNDELSNRTVEFDMNRPQLMARLVNANETWMLVGRGGGKTVGGIGPYLVNNILSMPRSSGGIVGISFEHLESNTLPPLIKSLADFGFHQDVDFTLGTKPPDTWPKPYIPVLNFKQSLIWSNGTAVQFVSLKRRASANALSLQWGIFDEVKFMDPAQLYDEIFPIFRGNEKYFAHQSEYLGKFFATDKKMEYARIKWILDKRELNNWDLVNTVITLQIDLNEKLQQIDELPDSKKSGIKSEIKELRWTLNTLRKNMVYVCEASALENIHFLGGDKWLKDKLRNTRNIYDFNVTYLNEDPDAADVLFYPDFKESVHCYDNPNDVESDQPLIIAADYQHSISPIPIVQINDKATGYKALNFVDQVFTLAPQGLTDAVSIFCNKYKSHDHKVVYYVYDQTAIGRRNDADSFFEIVIKTLKKHNWNVIEIYTGDAPDHSIKYEKIKEYLKGGGTMPIRVNRKCKEMIQSIRNSAAITKFGKTHKDKTDEKNSELDQSITTHFSDAFDQIVWAVLNLNLIKKKASGGVFAIR